MKPEEILKKQADDRRMVSSYIFSGSDLEVTYLAAKNLAEKIGASEYDLIEIEPEIIDKNSKGEIRVAAARELIRTIHLTPGRGKRKIAIIKDADRLNLEAANMLLKTLEEPPKSSLVILLSKDLKLLPTIISRCQIIKFPDKKGKGENDADYFIPDLEKENLAKIFSAADKLSKNQNLAAMLETMMVGARAEMLQSFDNGPLQKLKAIFAAKRDIGVTTNKKLVLECLFLKLKYGLCCDKN